MDTSVGSASRMTGRSPAFGQAVERPEQVAQGAVSAGGVGQDQVEPILGHEPPQVRRRLQGEALGPQRVEEPADQLAVAGPAAMHQDQGATLHVIHRSAPHPRASSPPRVPVPGPRPRPGGCPGIAGAASPTRTPRGVISISRRTRSCAPSRRLIAPAAIRRPPSILEELEQEDRVDQVAQAILGQLVRLGQGGQLVGQDGDDPHPVEVAGELVHVGDEELLVGHDLAVAVEAVDHQQPGPLLLDLGADPGGELVGIQHQRVDLLDAQEAPLDERADLQPDRLATEDDPLDLLLERVDHPALAPAGRLDEEAHPHGRLAGPGAAGDERGGAPVDPPAEQPVQPFDPAGDHLAGELPAVRLGDHARVDHQALPGQVQRVLAGGEVAVPILLDPQRAAVPAVAALGLRQLDDPVDEGQDLVVVTVVVALGEEEGRGPPAGQVVLQRQDLAAVADRVAGEEADLRHVIEDDPRRAQAIHRLDDLAGHRGQLDIGGVEDRVLALGGESVIAEAGVDVQDVDAFEVPAADRARSRGGPARARPAR